MSVSVEAHVRIYDDLTVTYVEVRPDRDEGDLVEVRHVDAGEETGSVIMTTEQARAMAKVLTRVARDIEQGSDK